MMPILTRKYAKLSEKMDHNQKLCIKTKNIEKIPIFFTLFHVCL